MGRGSVLKNLKSNLQESDLLRHQKRKKGNDLQSKQRKERDQQQLAAIRDAFNPFNAKFNREKSTGQGKKEAGRPVAARTAAEERRRRTWEVEKRLKNKVGGLVDRRFGESDKTMSEESKLIERYAREKLNSLRKSGNRKSFNINDEDMDDYTSDSLLTHGGKALTFEDDFAEDDLGVDSADDDEPSKKKIKRNEATSSLDEPIEESEEQKRPKTKAEVMQEVIAKSKMHKLERQQQRQADDALVDDLNEGFDDLMADLAAAEEHQKRQTRNVDEYDINLQQLAFDKRADPRDRTKTEEEIKEEREAERKAAERAKSARMEGDELDIDVDDAQDDANLFGLQDHSDDDYEESINGKSDGESDGENSHVSVEVPSSFNRLRDVLNEESNVEEKIAYFVQIATPKRGSGSKEQLKELAASLFEYAITNPRHFPAVARILHDISPKHDVGLRLANLARDLVNTVKRRKSWGSKEALLFSLIGSLFSTSDQWHVVATSASLVITQRLSQSVEADRRTVTINLFLCDLLLTYQRLSKRYIPEIPSYLLRVLVMLSSQEAGIIAERYTRVPSSKLVDHAGVPLAKIPKSVEGKAKLGGEATLDEIAVITSRIISKSASLWRSLEAFPEVLAPLHKSLLLLPNDEGNPVISETISKISKLLHFSSSERRYLELQQFKPIGIVTKAPLFDENYNPEIKGANMDPERRELQKLKALHKKERKSTLREIRRDTEFESRQLLDEKRKEMAAYHEKLRHLEGQINGEEGAERNAYEREKQKKRRH